MHPPGWLLHNHSIFIPQAQLIEKVTKYGTWGLIRQECFFLFFFLFLSALFTLTQLCQKLTCTLKNTLKWSYVFCVDVYCSVFLNSFRKKGPQKKVVKTLHVSWKHDTRQGVCVHVKGVFFNSLLVSLS